MIALKHVFIALSMSADAFAASISVGINTATPRLKNALHIAVIFALAEGTAPLIGWLLYSLMEDIFEHIDHWIAFTLLSLIGSRMILEALRSANRTHAIPKQTGRLLLTALGTSIDSMAVGASLALMQVNMWIMAALIGLVTFVMSYVGVIAGHRIGIKAGKWATLFGGLCLITIGTHILLTHLHIL